MDEFGSNAVRLTLRDWLSAGVLVVVVLTALPALAPLRDPDMGAPNYRLPIELSEDYWMFRQWSAASAARSPVVVMGDSVVWGHYVGRSETLSGCLNRRLGGEPFANLGVDGLHPLAIAGLLRHYGGDVAGRPVLLHLNVLWLSSPQRDLQSEDDQPFNHPRLVPQVVGRPAAYHPTLPEAMGALGERALPFLGWKSHLKSVCLSGLAAPEWTVQNPYTWPFGAASQSFGPGDTGPLDAPVSWRDRGIAPQSFEWVEAETSVQWRGFRAALAFLRARGSEVFVLVGPFNTHLLSADNRARHRELERALESWLSANQVAYLAPPPLPSDLYADASHPLGEGYARIAAALLDDPEFAAWIQRARRGPGR